MGWLWLIGGFGLLLWLGSLSRRAKQAALVAGLRHQFPAIARMRLVAACPDLDPVLDESELRRQFDWILAELYRRTGASGIGELMRWTIEHGEAEAIVLSAGVTRDAVDRLPPPVLERIDGCGGRTVAGVILDECLTEAGHRLGPELNRKYV